MEDYEIDDFEKLYVLTAAKLNSSLKLTETFNKKEDFDKICSLAKFKQDHLEMFNQKNRAITNEDKNYYVIPTNVSYLVRNGNETVLLEKQAYLLIDSAGNDIGLILENGDVVQDFGKTKKDDKEINTLNKENEKPKNEQDELENELENDRELEENNTVNSLLDKESKHRIYDEARLIGISPEVLDSITEQCNCRIEQINLRKIDDEELNEKITGLNLNMYRGKIVAVRMQYGNKYQGYLVNSETGEFFRPPKRLRSK